jgi:hypothetical protein
MKEIGVFFIKIGDSCRREGPLPLLSCFSSYVMMSLTLPDYKVVKLNDSKLIQSGGRGE